MDVAGLSLNGPSQLDLAKGAAGAPVAAPGKQDFGSLLTDLVEKVDGMQKDANTSMADVVSGKVTDVHQVAVKVQEAGLAFDLMLGVRNRLMDAYQELIKMQP
jgi:flagellar hook-basal body complex protein FliE